MRCGADILLSGLHQDVKGEAECPVCGNKIDVAIEGEKVVSMSPKSALLHYVVEDENRFSICCSGTILFDRELCLTDWLKSYEGPKGSVAPPQGFMDEALSRRGGRQRAVKR